jgi:hypothetical protein
MQIQTTTANNVGLLMKIREKRMYKNHVPTSDENWVSLRVFGPLRPSTLWGILRGRIAPTPKVSFLVLGVILMGDNT